jgi:hypothetical protein
MEVIINKAVKVKLFLFKAIPGRDAVHLFPNAFDGVFPTIPIGITEGNGDDNFF